MFPVSYPEIDNSSICPEITISTLPPIVNIFYLIQSFAPGILLLMATDETRGVYVTRSLPPMQWVEDNLPLLEHCLGPKVADKLHRAASDVTKSFHSGSVDEKVWPDDEPIQDPLDDWGEEMEEDWDRYDDEYEDSDAEESYRAVKESYGAAEETYGAAEESCRAAEESPSSTNDWHHVASNWDGWEVKDYFTCSASCGFCGNCGNSTYTLQHFTFQYCSLIDTVFADTPQETAVAHGW